VTALALVAAYPDDVVTLVAHEPPLIPVLPDAAAAERARAGYRDAYEAKGWGAGVAAFHRDGRAGASSPTSTSLSLRRIPPRSEWAATAADADLRAGARHVEVVAEVAPELVAADVDCRGSGAEGTRTPGPHAASVVLFQLSYSPNKVEVLGKVNAGSLLTESGHESQGDFPARRTSGSTSAD
jgi:hypothetical protein